MQRSFLVLLATALSFILASIAFGEVSFPKIRDTVGPGEYYVLDTFGAWRIECLRDEDGEDVCDATTEIADLDEGLALGVTIAPYVVPTKPSRVDVDIVPRAFVQIFPYSESEHYSAYSAAITAVDGQPFDGYWCKLTEPEDCNQGPELAYSDLISLLSAREATVTIYDSEATPENYEIKTTIELNTRDLRRTFDRANAFTASVFGIDLASEMDWTEVCTLDLEGDVKRISYTYDEDFDAQSTSLREILRGPRGAGNCPSYITLAYLTPDMTAAQRELFCLAYDEDDELVGFREGARDAYRACESPSRGFCERVNDSKETALAIAVFTSGAVGSVVGTTTVTGTTVVAHSSGAAIVTGTSGYVAGTLGTVGTTLLGVLTAPAFIAAASVSVVAVGGAVYVCSE